jgi:hypothetical protein
MKKFNYVAVAFAVICFASAVFAGGFASEIVAPKASKVISYFNQAHSQDQAY